jgi:arabinofuranosyltransferase
MSLPPTATAVAAPRLASPRSLLAPWSMSLLTGLVSVTMGMSALARSQPEEDAYILFRYVRHVVRGQGIVFNPGGVHAEGATDFLWMLLLSGLTALGLDTAVAAVLLNAAGAAAATFLLCRVVADAAPSPGWRAAWFALVPLAVLCSSGASAGLGGFSSMLYAALAVLAVHLALEAPPAKLHWLPGLALALGLFRPDGVFVGAGIAAVAGVRAWRLSAFRRYACSMGVTALLGAAYFAWRLRYFGLPLPLPLYVKSHLGEPERFARLPSLVRRLFNVLPGLGANLHWFTAGGALGALAAAAVCAVLLWRKERSLAPWPKRLAGALPLLALWGALCLALQMQNIDWRFQAPIQLGALYFAFRAVAAVRERRLISAGGATALLAVAAGGLVLVGLPRVNRQLDPERGGYLDAFAARLGGTLPPRTRIAVTEAGRLPYWTDAEVLDTIGLNSPDIALRPVSPAVLEKFDPQIVMFHHADTLDFSGLKRTRMVEPVESLAALVSRDAKRDFAASREQFSALHTSVVRLAAVVMARYLDDHRAQFDVIAVDSDGDGSYRHVYGFRKGMDLDAAVKMISQTARPRDRLPYLALRRAQKPF